MAGKNTAAFGIYPNETALENGITALQQAGFGTKTFRFCFRRMKAPRISRTEKGTKAPEGAATGAGQEQ